MATVTLDPSSATQEAVVPTPAPSLPAYYAPATELITFRGGDIGASLRDLETRAGEKNIKIGFHEFVDDNIGPLPNFGPTFRAESAASAFSAVNAISNYYKNPDVAGYYAAASEALANGSRNPFGDIAAPPSKGAEGLQQAFDTLRNVQIQSMLDDARDSNISTIKIGILKNEKLEEATLIVRHRRNVGTTFAAELPGEKSPQNAGSFKDALGRIEEYVLRKEPLQMPKPEAVIEPERREPPRLAVIYEFPKAS